MRDNHDWDAGYLMQMEVLKLKRMLKHFEGPDSHHSPDCENYKPKMKSLRLAIKLGERYLADDYYKSTVNFEMDIKLYSKDDKLYQIVWIDVDTGQPATKEKLEAWRAEYDRADEKQERDRSLFYRIIEKYGNYWWD
jgi:hypothetical protein